MKAEYYPDIAKKDLFEQGYIGYSYQILSDINYSSSKARYSTADKPQDHLILVVRQSI